MVERRIKMPVRGSMPVMCKDAGDKRKGEETKHKETNTEQNTKHAHKTDFKILQLRSEKKMWFT